MDPNPVCLRKLERRPWDFLEDTSITMDNSHCSIQFIGCSDEQFQQLKGIVCEELTTVKPVK
jgi:hypothetical protein